MSLPVSQYEALLAEVRGLRKRAQHVQQLVNPFINHNTSTITLGSSSSTSSSISGSIGSHPISNTTRNNSHLRNVQYPPVKKDHLIVRKMDEDFDVVGTRTNKECEGEQGTSFSEDECGGSHSSTHLSVSSEPIAHTSNNKTVNNLYHGTWPVEKTMWNSEPNNLGPNVIQNNHQVEVTSVMSFASSSGGVPLDRVLGSTNKTRRSSQQQLEAKLDMVYSLLAMLGNQEHADMGETLLALSTSPESCMAMRQSGCIPLLVQLVQSDKDMDTRKKASQALNNLVYSQPDEKIRKREIRLLKLLDQIQAYVDSLRNNTDFVPEGNTSEDNGDKHPVQAIAHLMKLSFDEGHRHAICQLGGIYVIANLVEMEHLLHGSIHNEANCILLRRYACMALTNLTFGDSGNKTLLCSFKNFMRALVVQLQSPCDELRQVTGSVLRNLSWRADQTSRDILREVGTVTGLMKASMMDSKENTLKSILSALWNLSAHCKENKLEICSVEGALGFLVDQLTYKTPSESLAVTENAGGILRNVSNQIAVRDDYREILRQHNCLQILLDQLKSPSLTIVSNACGTLWNLSAKNAADQETLWELGAPAMLRSLNHSKHKMIAMGSSAALKNLLGFKQSHSLLLPLDSTAKAMDLPVLPTLGARKQKALLQDLDQNLSETFENIERDSPTRCCREEKNQEYLSHYDLNPTLLMNLESSGSKDVKRINQAYSSVNAKKYVPMRNKYSDCDYEEELELSEEPINYSAKYTEKEEKRTKTSNGNNFGIYAETDLDQPTDYSLRYGENDDDTDSDTDVIGNKILQDTVKTYCTEGTPYETPFNFSNATSLSDLRIKNDNQQIDNDKVVTSIQSESNVKNKMTKRKDLSNSDEKDHCSIEDISEIETNNVKPIQPADKLLKSQFSSGLMSPEKPINYCEEGTPGYFSRVSSFGSLNSIPANETVLLKQNNEEKIIDVDESSNALVKAETAQNIDVKAVKFDESVNYAEETPLMFSRSSSLASLDSVEQHSIHDDRSSIVSDFSRLTSGIVSPSELPDSPTQTVPPSPRPRKGLVMDPSVVSKSMPPIYPRTAGDGRPQPAPRNIPKPPSIFEDNVTKFKEESTPVQFSTATSLSSLTIDDREDANGVQSTPQGTPLLERVSPMASGASGTTIEENGVDKRDENQTEDVKKNSSSSQLSDEEDENILADCINIGIQNNRHRQNSAIASNTVQPSSVPSTSVASLTKAPFSLKYTAKTKIDIQADTTCTYYTEDTPAILSHAGSNSDLSILSIPNESIRKKKDLDLSDDSSNLSGDNENILAECIQSAMPKPRRINDKIKQIPILNRNPYPTNNTTTGQFLNVTGLGARSKIPSRNQEKFYKKPNNFMSKLSSTTSPSYKDAGPSLLKTDSNNQLNEGTSPQESLSSLSVESLETEQQLLEQCISSGMPKSAPQQSSTILSQQTKDQNLADSKNVNAASVARNTETPQNQSVQELMCPKLLTTVTGVCYAKLEEDVEVGNHHHHRQQQQQQQQGNVAVGVILTKGALPTDTSTGPMKNGFSQMQESEYDDKVREDTSEPIHKVNNRMLDPDAMIESLDRFTAELVSQAVNARNSSSCNNSGFCTSAMEDNTWAEDDSSFPNITESVPIVHISSNENNLDIVDGITKQESNDFSSINASLTQSTLIAMEAHKIAAIMKQEADMGHSLTSVNSLELDNVSAPPELFSLSFSESPKPQRKKMPTNFLIKKILSNSIQRTSSSESLENQMSISNLDQVNPPSRMADVFDMDDSLNSVASLINDFAATTVNTADAFRNILTGNSLESDHLADMNPPSLLNYITTETYCSHTDDYEDCRTHMTDDPLKTENDVTEFYDVHSDTPVPSDISNSSTPKRIRNVNKHLTPKQKRNLAKERYKTYTIAAEMVMRDEQTKTQEEQNVTDVLPVTRDNSKKGQSKMSPKQKRLENRSRYETQILDETLVSCLNISGTPPSSSGNNNSDDSFGSSPLDSNSPIQSPARTKQDIRKSFMQKRLENKDRFRTQTLSESSLSPDISSACNSPPLPVNNLNNPTVQDIHYLVQREANVVLKSLQETKSKADDLLDCETLSLISIDDDSDHNSGCSITNYRTYHKSWGVSNNNAPIIDDLNTNTSQCLQNRQQDEQGEHNEQQVLLDDQISNEDDDQIKQKPKIVKPTETNEVEDDIEEKLPPPQEKVIRGRRKPLYSKICLPSTSKPKLTSQVVTNVTSNFARNATSNVARTVASTVTRNGVFTARSNGIQSANVNVIGKPINTKLPPVQQKRTLRPPTRTIPPSTSNKSNLISPKHTAVKTSQKPSPTNSTKSSPSSSAKSSPKHQPQFDRTRTQNIKPPVAVTHTQRHPSTERAPPTERPSPMERPPSIERQGTFTKEDTKTTTTSTVTATTSHRSKIPTASSIPKPRSASSSSSSRLKTNGNYSGVNQPISGLNKPNVRGKPPTAIRYNRSASASSESNVKKNDINNMVTNMTKRTNQKLKVDNQRSKSSTSINLLSNGANSQQQVSTKQVTSKIATLLKKIEETKQQPKKPDSRVWIQPDIVRDTQQPRLINNAISCQQDEDDSF